MVETFVLFLFFLKKMKSCHLLFIFIGICTPSFLFILYWVPNCDSDEYTSEIFFIFKRKEDIVIDFITISSFCSNTFCVLSHAWTLEFFYLVLHELTRLDTCIHHFDVFRNSTAWITKDAIRRQQHAGFLSITFLFYYSIGCSCHTICITDTWTRATI